MEINFNSRPNKGKDVKLPAAPSIANNGVVQYGQPGVKTAKVLPKALEPPLGLMAIKLTLLILKIISEMVIPAKIAVASVKLRDAAR